MYPATCSGGGLKNAMRLIFNWNEMDIKSKIIKISLSVLGAAFITLGYAIATGISVATLGIGALIAVIATAVIAVVAFIVKIVNEKSAIKSTEQATN